MKRMQERRQEWKRPKLEEDYGREDGEWTGINGVEFPIAEFQRLRLKPLATLPLGKKSRPNCFASAMEKIYSDFFYVYLK